MLKFIDVAPEDFSDETPLTSYGLDSLSASMLASALHPLLSITQVHLLSDLSLNDIIKKAKELQNQNAGLQPSRRNVSWTSENRTIIRLRGGRGTPLIIIHGGAGDVTPFTALLRHFCTPLWAIQPEEHTPMDSLASLVQLYYESIKKERPFGPYRLAGFSASSLITLNLGRLFESQGDELVQLTFIDHFPLLFASSAFTSTYEPSVISHIAQSSIKETINMVVEACKRESNVTRQIYGQELLAASSGNSAPAHVLAYYSMIQKITTLNCAYCFDLVSKISEWTALDTSKRLDILQTEITTMLQGLSAPITVYIAENGLTQTLSLPEEWHTLGTALIPAVHTIMVNSAHFDIFEQDFFAQHLQSTWLSSLWKDYQMPATFRNADQEDLTVLFSLLDSFAFDAIESTLRKAPIVGSDVSLYHNQ